MNPNRTIAFARNHSRFSLHAPPRQSSSEHLYEEPDDSVQSNPIISRHHSLLEPKAAIIRQLIDTESNYVQALSTILARFKPLKNREDFLSIYQHVEYFHNLHSAFHACLYRQTEVAVCFLKFKDKFTRYGCYCVALFQSQSALDARNDELLEQREAKFKLRDLLFLPIQRILKYPLLLSQIIEKTPNKDDQNLRRAHDIMVDLCHHLNEIKRDTEAIQIINEIEQSITGLPAQLIDYGRLLRDGKVKLRLGDSNDVQLKVYVFLFDKALLICKPNQSKLERTYQFRELLNLRDYELRFDQFNSEQLGLVRVEKWSHSFTLFRLADGTKFHLYAKTAELKSKWTNAISEAKANMRPQSIHEFVKSNFDVTSYCDNCKKILHGMFFQGYKCRVCSIAVHKECVTTHKACRSTNLDSPTAISDDMYVNFKLSEYPWFVGRMGREQAQSILENTPDGTFLVRESPKHNCSLVISLNYASKVNHMRVFVSSQNEWYLSENRYFKSLVELVNWYKTQSLIENFQMLDARLENPIYG